MIKMLAALVVLMVPGSISPPAPLPAQPRVQETIWKLPPPPPPPEQEARPVARRTRAPARPRERGSRGSFGVVLMGNRRAWTGGARATGAALYPGGSARERCAPEEPERRPRTALPGPCGPGNIGAAGAPRLALFRVPDAAFEGAGRNGLRGVRPARSGSCGPARRDPRTRNRTPWRGRPTPRRGGGAPGPGVTRRAARPTL